MEIAPFDPSDLVHIHPPMLTPAQWFAFAASYRDAGLAYTLVDDDTVLGCAGLMVSGRVGLAWAALSDAIRARPFILHRTVKRKLDQIVIEHELEQVVSTVNNDFSAGRRWIERLGFCQEGILTDYMGSGETHVRYVLYLR